MARKNYKVVLFTVVLLAAAGVFLFFFASAAGMLSDDTRTDEQNVLGGRGKLRTFSQNRKERNSMFEDDLAIYYSRQSPSGGNMLYAYNKETGREKPVCDKSSCRHDTPDCSVYLLYLDNSFLSYVPLDKYLYYSYRTKQEGGVNAADTVITTHLCRWDIQTGEHEEIHDFAGNFWLTDENGMRIQVEFGPPNLGRISPDTLFVSVAGQIYLFDNDFSLKESLDADTTSIAWSEDFLVWENQEMDLDAYCISTGQHWHNLLQTACKEQGALRSEYFFLRENAVYCVAGKERKIVTFAIGDNSFRELSGPVSTAFQGMVSRVGDCLYYLQEERVFCLNLVTEQEQVMAGMDSVPRGRLEDGTLFAFDANREPVIVRYNANGKEARP